MEGSILSVGDAVLDLLCTPLPDLPEGDRQLPIGRITPSPGGNSLNFALAAGAIYDNVIFHGAVGEDPFGDMLVDLVSKHSIDAQIRRLMGAGTATTVAIPDRRGGRRLLTHSGANAFFDPDPKDISLDHAVHLHRGGYWFTEKLRGDSNLELLRAAREAGVETSLDPATDPLGWDHKRIDPLLRSLPYIDILFLNEAELNGISGSPILDDGVRELLDLGVGAIVLHLGENGIRWDGKLGSGSMEGYKLTEMRNPTGSGDVFNGAFIALRAMGRSFEGAISGGQTAAAVHITDHNDPYPALDRIERFRCA
jgi:sugar/nucleoside kinase (ribokinase family)